MKCPGIGSGEKKQWIKKLNVANMSLDYCHLNYFFILLHFIGTHLFRLVK